MVEEKEDVKDVPHLCLKHWQGRREDDQDP